MKRTARHSGVPVRRGLIVLLIAAFLVFAMSSWSPAWAQGEEPSPTETPEQPTLPEVETLPGDYAPDEVVVKLSNANSNALRRGLKPFGKIVENGLEDSGVLILKVEMGTVSQVIAALQDEPGVVYAEPNYYVYALNTYPNDPGWINQYGPTAIRAPQGWDMATGSSAVTIAILDSGVDPNHPDLAGKLVAGYNFVSGNTDTHDDYGHGTHVAGVAAALSNNGVGIAGISWGAQIMPVKVLNSFGSGTYANVAAGIHWAVENGARVLNLSLGGSTSSQTLKDAVDQAVADGAVLVAAAGNNGSFVLYPAAYPDVVAVGATDQTNTRVSNSSIGAQLDLMAPGLNIYTTQIGGGLTYDSGTSLAAPFVSGVAAILIGVPGNGYSSTVIDQMTGSALDLGDTGNDDKYGYGLVQLDGALRLAGLTPPNLHAATRTHTPDPITAVATQAWYFNGHGGVGIFTVTPTLMQGSPTPGTPEVTPAEVSALVQTSTITPTPTATATLTVTSTTTLTVTTNMTGLPAQETPFALPLPCLGAAFLLAGAAIILYLWGYKLQHK
jgi:subtilisin family serine protease